jgi:hypothetical protein
MTTIGFADYGLPRGQFADLARSEATIWRDGGSSCGTRVPIGDLGASDHAVVFVSSRAFTARLSVVRCRVSLLLLEPRVIHGRYYAMLPLVARRYHRIFTHDLDLSRRLVNARRITHGGSWLETTVDPMSERSGHMSLIASAKATTEGHRLRHRIATWVSANHPDVQLLGRRYRPFEDRSEGFLPFRYSVVIENCRSDGYFTEKLIDCLLCGTVPIYWGDPAIGKYLDLAGILACADEYQLRQAIARASVEDFAARAEARRRNAEVAREFIDHRPAIAAILARDG